MKTLSIRQPWADLIIQGKKTLELRSWTVSHRGTLAIHASQSVDKPACRANGIDPRHVSVGVVIGFVELIDIIPLDEAAFEAHCQQHLSTGIFKPPLYGWKISKPIVLEKPVPYTGRMGLFNITDDLISSEEQKPKEEALTNEEISFDSRHPFELQVKLEQGSNPSLASYRLALFQYPVGHAISDVPQVAQPGFSYVAPPQRRLVCELGGTAMKAVADAVLEALRLNGYAATDLGIKRREPFQLTEESGVRLALIFLTIRPISKVSRIEEISRGIRAMTGEELYYWFAKCTTTGAADQAQKALRILLSDE